MTAAESTESAARQAARAAALMWAWRHGPGELERMPFDRRARFAERLRTSRLAPWAELIGRFRQMAEGERAREVENTKGNWSASHSATTPPARLSPSRPVSAWLRGWNDAKDRLGFRVFGVAAGAPRAVGFPGRSLLVPVALRTCRGRRGPVWTSTTDPTGR